jgi:hypothetical protein
MQGVAASSSFGCALRHIARLAVGSECPFSGQVRESPEHPKHAEGSSRVMDATSSSPIGRQLPPAVRHRLQRGWRASVSCGLTSHTKDSHGSTLRRRVKHWLAVVQANWPGRRAAAGRGSLDSALAILKGAFLHNCRADVPFIAGHCASAPSGFHSKLAALTPATGRFSYKEGLQG